MRRYIRVLVVVGAFGMVGAALSGCTNRPLSMLDTWFGTNDHPHLVWSDGQVRYSDELEEERMAAADAQ